METSAWQLRQLVYGYRVSQAIHVAATLNLSDLLAEGPRGADDLATETKSDPPSLARLLNALSAVGLYEQLPDGRYASTELGDALRSTAPEPVDGYARFIGTPNHWQAWTGLLHSVQTGENAFQFVHGEGVWDYRAGNPGESQIFDAAMTANSRAFAAAVLSAYDFGRFSRVVDIAGGRGAFLAAILAAHPDARGVLFDQQHVLVGAPELLEAAGVADRCRLIAGDFFTEIPDGGDAYVLKAILHDWDDERSLDLLRACRRSMGPDATLIIVERLLDGGNLDAAISDLNMLVDAGGQERTTAQYRDLLAAAGFRLTRTVTTASEVSVIEAVVA